jgi:hypothetical protein
MMEIHVDTGQCCTVLLARSRGPAASLNTFFIGASVSRSFDLDPSRGEIERWRRHVEVSLGSGGYRKYAAIDSWLTELITRRVPDDRRELYGPTIALADILFSAPTFNAIQFPSVATEHQGINLCLEAAEADRLFVPHEAWMFRFGSWVHHPQFEGPAIQFERLRRSFPIGADGTIRWMPDGHGVGSADFATFARGRVVPIVGTERPSPATKSAAN